MKNSQKAAAIAAVIGLTSCLGALPAQADIKGYNAADRYGSPMYSKNTASYINVIDDKTSSVENFTFDDFSGRNIVTAWFSKEAFFFSGGSIYNRLGDANNVIDHYDRV